MRVVLDTNVLISALLFKQRLGEIETMIKRGIIIPCFIVSTFQELWSVLHYPKLQPKLRAVGTTAEQIITSLTPRSLIFSDPIEIPQLVSDISDNFILACGKAAHADFIVTGDKLLLALDRYDGIPIISPQKFLNNYSK